ncbi:MAG: amidohydrolase family protein, partial [Ginsengibacter sp.]
REAHKRHLKVTGHIGTITYREAANLGIDNLEHGFMASSDFDKDKKPGEYDFAREDKSLQNLDVNSDEMKSLIHLLIKKKVALTSTLPVFEPNTNREFILGGGEDALLPEVREMVKVRWQGSQHTDSAELELFKKEMAWEKQFYDEGGLLVCGTDPTGSGRTLPGYGSRREIELLVEGGFIPVQAIKIATLNGAKYLERDKTIGTVEIGKHADLVLIEGDPENNISDIRKTETVFKNGIGFDSKKIFDSVKGKVGMN